MNARTAEAIRHPGAAWRGGLLYAVVGVAMASAVFCYRQNVGGQIGGPMSVEKILWLNYAITAWFVVPFFLARHPGVDPALRRLLGLFVAGMVARGTIELWLLYVTVSWDPLYGIAHDLASIALVVGLRRGLRSRRPGFDALDRDVWRFTWSLQASLVAEIVFAVLFRRMGVHGQAVYFAADTAEFAHINLLTRVVDVVVYADLARFLWRGRGRLLFHAAAEGVPR